MNDVLDKIPSQEIAEKRFYFIKDRTLRTNMVIAFRYMFFLLILENEYKLPGPISYSIYKNIIIYTAAIAESVLHYCLKTLLKEGLIESDKTLSKEWKERLCKDIYKISENEKVCGVIKHETIEKFSEKTQYQTLNRCALRSGIFNQDLFEKSEKLREKRNRIHLAGLKKVDDLYGETDTKEAFTTTANIIKVVESKILSI